MTLFRAMTDNTKGIIYAGIAAFMWGFLAIIMKFALEFLPPATLAWFRFTVAFVMLMTYLAIADRANLGILIKPPPKAILAAVFLAYNYLGFISGLNYTTPGNSQIYIQTGPLSLALIGIFFFKEKISLRQMAGFLVVLSGFWMFYSEQIDLTDIAASDYKKGAIWIISSGISWAIFSSIQKTLVRNESAAKLNMVIFAASSLLLIPFVDFKAVGALNWWQFLIAVSLGLNTLIAYGSLALALKYTAANKISVVLTLNPIITFGSMVVLEALAVTWIDPEKLNLLSLLGALTVILGAVLVIYKRKNRATLTKENV